MSLSLEAGHGLLDWTVGPGLGRLRQAGVGTGLGVQVVVAVVAVGPQTGAVGASLAAVGGAGVTAGEHKLQGERKARLDSVVNLLGRPAGSLSHTKAVSQGLLFSSLLSFTWRLVCPVPELGS